MQDHDLTFELAEEAFDDPYALTNEDYLDENGEMRYQTIAAVDGVVFMIAHVYRFVDVEERPRVISFRKAANYEKKQYFRRR